MSILIVSFFETKMNKSYGIMKITYHNRAINVYLNAVRFWSDL